MLGIRGDFEGLRNCVETLPLCADLRTFRTLDNVKADFELKFKSICLLRALKAVTKAHKKKRNRCEHLQGGSNWCVDFQFRDEMFGLGLGATYLLWLVIVWRTFSARLQILGPSFQKILLFPIICQNLTAIGCGSSGDFQLKFKKSNCPSPFWGVSPEFWDARFLIIDHLTMFHSDRPRELRYFALQIGRKRHQA